MKILDPSFPEYITAYLRENDLSDFVVGRVTQEHRERYIVSTGDKEYEAEITGNLRFTAAGRSDFPAVGDWVAMKVYDPDIAIIHHILPRKSLLERQSVSKAGEKQVISANVDVAFVVQSIDSNFNINRLERYMTICHSSGIEPILVLSKIDLAGEKEIEDAVNSVRSAHPGLRYVLLDNFSYEGIDQIISIMISGCIYCVVGSSGTGKSTLINNLLQENILRTNPISTSTGKGKHTTEHRELFVLNNGAMIIDTPGMRELGITDDSEGIRSTFSEIHELSLRCKFTDCTHTDEKGCAVIEALEAGLIDDHSLENYRRLLREQVHFSETIAECRKKDREFGKMAKRVLADKKKLK